MDNFYKQLKQFGRVKLNKSLKNFTTFKIGGPARFFVEVNDKQKLVELLKFLEAEGQEYLILGGGSNLLLSDEELDLVAIRIQNREFRIENSEIYVEAGVSLGQLVNLATQNNLTGMEWGAGIPGTVGGAVRGNAGAFGESTSDSLECVEVYRDGEVVEINNQDCEFGYRESIFKHNTDIILSATFKLELGEKSDIMKKVQENISYRSGRFAPHPSAGSFFKNLSLEDWQGDKKELPPKFLKVGKLGVAWLIDQCNLKGYTVGGAKVSEEHANFIVNFNNATQADVLGVVEHVKQEVYNKYRIDLEPEVQIIS